MTLRNRFTLISSLTFGIFSVITAVIIFWAFYDSSRNFYYNSLQNIALTSAIYYLEKDELPQDRHAQIKSEYNNLIRNTNVAVYDSNNKVAFGENINDHNIHLQQLNLVRMNKRTQFMSRNHFYYGIYYPDNQGDFVVFVKSSNAQFKAQITRLLIITVSVLLLGFLAIFLLSRHLSKIVYKPISDVVKKVNDADYSNITEAITSSGTHDEIDELINSYNKLLSRISESMLVQQNFINYVSHEFKTPLAAISGNLEVFAQKDRTPEEYKEVVRSALEQVYEIERIINNLLLMSGVSKMENAHQFFRLDELVFKIYENIKSKAKELDVHLNIDLNVKNAQLLAFNGNETLLHLGLYNIVENAVKYSPGSKVEILFSEDEGHLKLKVEDHGKGIPMEDIGKITETFFRGRNVGNISGSGIGLSLSKTIFDFHQIKMQITSTENSGTSVALLFPAT